MSLADLGAPASSRLGRYFDVVTFVPTAAFVAYLYFLIRSEPWDGRPDWSRAMEALVDVKTAILLAALSLVLSLVLHPLQFGMIQLLEGYWGVSRAAQALMRFRVLTHRARREALEEIIAKSAVTLGMGSGSRVPEHVDEDKAGALLAYSEAFRLVQRYPDDRSGAMPTRLGNILRRYERQAGAQYGLPVMSVAPHLSLVAPAEHWEYVTDQRTTMDRAVRLCWLSAIAALATVGCFWRSGWWLLLAGIPYAATYFFYRGALIVAVEYCTACATVLDLNRFVLYERLEYPRPATAAGERKQNAVLLRQLRRAPVAVRYRRPG